MTPTLKQLVAMNAPREQIENWARLHAQAVPAGTDQLLCRVLGKHLMYVLQRDTALTPHLALSGIWEPWVSMAIARHLQPGMRCLDVGACYGYYSLLMADIVGAEGHVEAWEPVRPDLLRTNIAVNGASVHVVARAMGTLSTSAGMMALFEDSPARAFFNAGGATMRRAGKLTSFVESTTIGVPIEAPTPLPWDFIKIDVEGTEADVWRALDEVKAVSLSLTVCMEFTPKHHEDPQGFLGSIAAEGFTIGTVGHDGFARPCSIEEAVVPDTGEFRMLWLSKEEA